MWLITGASSGLGKAIASNALKEGYKVIGTTRNEEKARQGFPEFESNGGMWLSLDPGKEDAFDKMREFSNMYSIDVLVNNAGYAFIGGVEDTSEEEIRSQMEVNFYGPLRLIRAILPQMRAKNSGNIVLISSGAGFIARPARATYSASKFAIEAIHESLSQELETFGVRVLVVEPGAFRTPFSSRILTPAQIENPRGFSEAYKGTPVEQMVDATRSISSMSDHVKGDPEKAAQAIINAVEQGHDYLRLPLGSDCVSALETKIAQLKSDLDKTRKIALSTDIS
ncbi:NAD(P)-binding protein [Penicillium macrosclerotiorum]|uniref:NAD(P)-binding protein n=1 Tax=Penicillium macrosclerotiorum TaxID=303699 RepID=UPI00254942E0|nr:NAD(P)-binding protein [Penicillium macrosclerotiorum]KAJ5692782.1 NAD(P)-binding protein [Penicillium macrosclerotiorum]